MRFMVQMVVRLPGEWPAQRLEEIGKAENARGHELINAGLKPNTYCRTLIPFVKLTTKYGRENTLY